MIVLHYTGMQFCPRGHPPAVRSEGPRLVALCGARKRLDRSTRAGEPSAPGTPACRPGRGDPDINSRSIGIEICNPGHDFGYPDFPSRQIAATITLCRAILTRNIIRPENIVAHSDVAPSRKQDPGEKFPWKLLAQSGVGLWVDVGTVFEQEPVKPDDTGVKVTELQKMLAEYGYGIDVTGRYDVGTTEVVTAFQRHFRPAQVDGIADAATLQTLRKLADRPRFPAAEASRRSEASRRAQRHLACLLTAAASHPIPSPSVGWTAAPAITERWPGRKVRAPWTNGAG